MAKTWLSKDRTIKQTSGAFAEQVETVAVRTALSWQNPYKFM